MLLPQLLLDLRKLLLDQSATGALVNIDELGQVSWWRCRKEYMHMVTVVIPFLDTDLISGLYILKDLFQPCWNGIIYNPLAVLNHHNQVVIERKRWVAAIIKKQCSAPLRDRNNSPLLATNTIGRGDLPIYRSPLHLFLRAALPRPHALAANHTPQKSGSKSLPPTLTACLGQLNLYHCHLPPLSLLMWPLR